MSLSPSDRPSSDTGFAQAQQSEARALSFRYFHTGCYILDREHILCVVDLRPRFVEIRLVVPSEERLHFKSPALQHTFLEWYTQPDPAEALGRWLLQARMIQLQAHCSVEDSSSSS